MATDRRDADVVGQVHALEGQQPAAARAHRGHDDHGGAMKGRRRCSVGSAWCCLTRSRRAARPPAAALRWNLHQDGPGRPWGFSRLTKLADEERGESPQSAFASAIDTN